MLSTDHTVNGTYIHMSMYVSTAQYIITYPTRQVGQDGG